MRSIERNQTNLYLCHYYETLDDPKYIGFPHQSQKSRIQLKRKKFFLLNFWEV